MADRIAQRVRLNSLHQNALRQAPFNMHHALFLAPIRREKGILRMETCFDRAFIRGVQL